jgi:hemerythrin superfamily protein
MVQTKSKGILELIVIDHRKVEQLFEEIDDAKSPEDISGCFQEIYTELILHAKAEEAVFYPALREHEETKRFVDEAVKEHKDAEKLLENLRDLSPSEPTFKTRLKALKDEVMYHVKEEEGEIFKAVRHCMSEADLNALADAFSGAKSTERATVEAKANS